MLRSSKEQTDKRRHCCNREVAARREKEGLEGKRLAKSP